MDQWLPVCLPGIPSEAAGALMAMRQLLRFTAAAVAVAVVDAGFCLVDVVVAESDFKILTQTTRPLRPLQKNQRPLQRPLQPPH